MHKLYPDLVHYTGIQHLLTNYLSEGIKPTSKQLQEREFGAGYEPDSKYQTDVVYEAIQRGRRLAINKWENYVTDQSFIDHLYKIQQEEPERIEQELNSDDFQKFNEIILSNDLNKNKRKALQELGQHPVIAVVFSDKVKQYSQQKNNLVISTYGKESFWYLPSFWAWNIREEAIYQRTIDILGRQLHRGIVTKILLKSKVSIEKVLGYQTNIVAALMDGTSWGCPSCGAPNIATKTRCTICDAEKGGPTQ